MKQENASAENIAMQETVERIKATIKAPAIDIDGGSYKCLYDLDNAESIKKYIKNNLRGKIFINRATGKSIIISGNSAGKLASYHSEGELHQRTIAHIPIIINSMLPLGDTVAEKSNAKHEVYSYYITPVNLKLENGIAETCSIFSTVGYSGNYVYYDQTVFKGTPREVYLSARNAPTAKNQRLAELLKDVGECDWGSVLGPTEGPAIATSTTT